MHIFFFFRVIWISVTCLPFFHAFLLNAESSILWGNCYEQILLKSQENKLNKLKKCHKNDTLNLDYINNIAKIPSFSCLLYHRGSTISGQLSTPYVPHNSGPETKCRLILVKQQPEHESHRLFFPTRVQVICILKQLILKPFKLKLWE